MMKKVLATVLALSVFSVSASTLPAELGNLKGIELKLIEQGVDVESLKESALELNLDPTLTDEEIVATVVDFTQSQLETGAAFEGDVGSNFIVHTALALLVIGAIVGIGGKDSHRNFAKAAALGGLGTLVYCLSVSGVFKVYENVEDTPKGC